MSKEPRFSLGSYTDYGDHYLRDGDILVGHIYGPHACRIVDLLNGEAAADDAAHGVGQELATAGYVDEEADRLVYALCADVDRVPVAVIEAACAEWRTRGKVRP